MKSIQKIKTPVMSGVIERINNRVAEFNDLMDNIPDYTFHYKLCKKCNRKYIPKDRIDKHHGCCSARCESLYKERESSSAESTYKSHVELPQTFHANY